MRGVFMSIDISKAARTEAITFIERYFRENMGKNMGEKIGNIAAGTSTTS